MAGSHEQSIDRVATMTEKEVSVQPPIGFHVTDGGLDGRSSLHLPLHGGGQAALAAGDHHRTRAGVIMAAIVLVDVDAVRIDTPISTA